MLADDMGLGKTAQAIRAADAVRAKRVLVICPAGVRPVWRAEIDKWTLGDARWMVRGYTEIVRSNSKYADAVKFKPDLLILDEAHYLKSPRAKRTKRVYGPLARVAGRVWALTGTPMPNDPSELWTHARVLGGEERRYEEFVHHLYRRTKDVRAELPEIDWQEWPVEGRMPDLSEAVEPAVWTRLQTLLESIDDDADAGARIDAAEELERLAPHLGTLRRLVGLAKVKGVCERLLDETNADHTPRVIMAYHRDVMEEAVDLLGGQSAVAMIHGSTTPAAREEAVRRFQAGEVPFFLGQIQAAGTGLTLTAAHHLVFLELDWSPANIAQAAKRIHRIGQDEPCLIRTAHLPNSLDEAISRTLTSKARMTDTLFAGVRG